MFTDSHDATANANASAANAATGNPAAAHAAVDPINFVPPAAAGNTASAAAANTAATGFPTDAAAFVADAFAAAGDPDASDDFPAAADSDDSAAAADAPSPLDTLAVENARLRETCARALADFDNYRRRAAREKEDLRKFAIQNLVEDLIPILDNLAIGLAAAGKHPEAEPVTAGFRMIAAQIKSVLEQNGLAEINPAGAPFDPNAHESVSQTPHDTIPDHHVAAVLRVGYRIYDRLVRPATVVLSSGPSGAAPAASPNPSASADTAASPANSANPAAATPDTDAPPAR